ncbi:hypothetical protein JTB14_025485 [Gonioctena quinquepunctata]|nr:hypothetical protein JTB14_025485 [Gonioctena quinquepunctata]
MGYEILGLLDSGASATILGSRRWKIMRDLGIELDTTERTRCTVTNGQVCESIGECQVPSNVKLVEVLVVPSLYHNLILGINFWKAMGIVPDLRHNEWYFSNESYYLDAVDHLRSQTVLTTMEEMGLKAVIDRNVAAMGDKLRCTHTAEHVIVTKAVPIKQVLPRVASDSAADVGDAHYLSSLVIKSAYWQVPVAESSRSYTTFTVPGRGLFWFRSIPFGLHNSPPTWQRLIDIYLDDVVVVTQTFEKHLSVLDEVFRRLREADLTVSLQKCHFCRPEMKYLGHVVDRNGLHVDPKKVNQCSNSEPRLQ